MTKKNDSGEYAKMLYIVHGMSLQDISAKLGISYRALQNWKKEGGWDAEKQRIAEAEGMVHSSVYAEFAKELRMIRMGNEQGTGLDIDNCKKLDYLVKIARNMLDYEKNAPKKSEHKKSPQEIASEIDKILRGED